MTTGQIQQLVAEAAEQALKGLVAQQTATPVMAPRVKRQRGSAAKARNDFTSVAAKMAQPMAQAKASVAGRSPVGPVASMTAKLREAQLEQIVPGWRAASKLRVKHVGKVNNVHTQDLSECDKAGVGIWTFVTFNVRNKAEFDALAQAAGIDGATIRADLIASGYSFYAPDGVWRTRCDGTPASGRFGKRGNSLHIGRKVMRETQD